MIKYRISPKFIKAEIEEIEVIRETEKCVYVASWKGETREAKQSEWQEYYDTWEEARDRLIARIKIKIGYHRRGLEANEELLDRVERLEKELSCGGG